MSNKDNIFEEKLKQELSVKLLDLEGLRIKYSNNKKYIIVLYIIISLVLYYVAIVLFNLPFFAIIWCIAMSFVLNRFIIEPKFFNNSGIYEYIKKEILETAFKLYDNNLAYHSLNGFSEQTFDESLIPKFSYNNFKSEDMIKGKVDDTTISMSEINAWYRSKNSSHTIFKGILLKAQLNFNIEGYFVIRAKEKNELLAAFRGVASNLLQDIFNIDKSDLKEYTDIKDEHLKNDFEIYSSHSFIAESILTPDFIDNFTEFNKFDYPLSISFINNQFYAAGTNKNDFLEIDMTKSLKNLTNVDEEIMPFIKLLRTIKLLDIQGAAKRISK